MKPKLLIYASFTFFLFLHSRVNGAITVEEQVKNEGGDVVFRVLDSNQVRVHNRHRVTSPAVALSLGGVTIDKVEKASATNWKLLLSDKATVELSVEEKGSNVTEYYLYWPGTVTHNEKRGVCFHYAYHQAYWYNAYQSMNASWPMNTAKNVPTQQFNFVMDFDRFATTDKTHREAILIVEQLFLNSDGFAVVLEQDAPWFIRRAQNGQDPLLCFSVNNSYPYLDTDTDASYLDMKIRLFSSTNAKTVSDYVQKSKFVSKPTKIHDDEKLFREPIWFTDGFSDQDGPSQLNVTGEIIQHGFSPNSTIIYHYWHTSNIDQLWALDWFPTNVTILDVKAKGFQIGVEFLEPYILNYKHDDKLCIGWTMFLDFTVPEAAALYLSQLNHLRELKPQLDTFLFSANTNLYVHEFNDTRVRKYPNLYTSKYIELMNQVSNTRIISDFGYKSQHLPAWVRLGNHIDTPYEQLLAELIPNVLSVSIAGYSFFVPYSVGKIHYFNHSPTEEQVIRWIQAITFMPALSFTIKPWDYSVKAVELTKKFVNLHAEHSQTMIELAKKRIQDGSPIIRPIWYVAPDDPKTYPIGDQYMLGEDILVAPVVVIGQTERTVYLISGTWIDQHGKSYQGPGQFKVAAPLEELPYFKRKV